MSSIQRTLLAVALGLVAAVPAAAQGRAITSEDVERIPNAGTAFDVVQTLRPRWLKPKELRVNTGADVHLEPVTINVYLDGLHVGTAEYLKTIPAERVQQLRWLSMNQAASLYGPNDGPGIEVTLKR